MRAAGWNSGQKHPAVREGTQPLAVAYFVRGQEAWRIIRNDYIAPAQGGHRARERADGGVCYHDDAGEIGPTDRCEGGGTSELHRHSSPVHSSSASIKAESAGDYRTGTHKRTTASVLCTHAKLGFDHQR